MTATLIHDCKGLFPSIRTAPGSSTAKQHRALILSARSKGLNLDQLRDLCGGSLRALSAAQCSELIKGISGRDLPHPPGGKPWPYSPRRSQSRERKRPDGRATAVSAMRPVPRMIQDSHVEQIGRLMLRYFEGNVLAARQWFEKNWKVKEPRDLLSTKRAGQVIRALKEMVQRKES